MEGVDRLDQMTNPYKSTQKCMKWYKKYFFSLLDKGVYNCLVIYLALHEENMSLLSFREQIIRGLLENYFDPENRRNSRRSNNQTPLRLNSRCFPDLIPAKIKKYPTKRCVVCTKNELRK